MFSYVAYRAGPAVVVQDSKLFLLCHRVRAALNFGVDRTLTRESERTIVLFGDYEVLARMPPEEQGFIKGEVTPWPAAYQYDRDNADVLAEVVGLPYKSR